MTLTSSIDLEKEGEKGKREREQIRTLGVMT